MEVPTARIPCAKCGFTFWVPTSFDNTRRDNHETLYCPACGEHLSYPDLSVAEKCAIENISLKKWLRLSLDRGASSERSRISQKGATTKLRNRLAELEEANLDS